MGKSNKPTKWFKAVKKAFRSPSKERPASPDHQETKADAEERLLAKHDLSPGPYQAPTPHPLPSYEIITHEEVEPENSRAQPLPTPEAVAPVAPPTSQNLSGSKDLGNVIEEEENAGNNVDVEVVEKPQDEDDDSALSEEEEAAARIRQRFSEPMALTGLIRLQAVVRGHQVRRQAATTLQTMEAIVRVQAVFRGRRVRMSKSGRAVRSRISKRRRLSSRAGAQYGDVRRAPAFQGKEPEESRDAEKANKSNRPTAYILTQRLKRSAPNRTALFIDCGPGESEESWAWLELWTNARPWEVRTLEEPKGSKSGKDSKASKDYIEIIPGSRKSNSEFTTKEVDVNTLKVKYYEDYVSNPTAAVSRSSNPSSGKKEFSAKSASPMSEKKESARAASPASEKKESARTASPVTEKKESARAASHNHVSETKEPAVRSPKPLPEKKEPVSVRSSQSPFSEKKESSNRALSSPFSEKRDSFGRSSSSPLSQKKESVRSSTSSLPEKKAEVSTVRSPSSPGLSAKREPDYVASEWQHVSSVATPASPSVATPASPSVATPASPSGSSTVQSHRTILKPPPIEVPALPNVGGERPIQVEHPKSPVREKSLPPSPAVSATSVAVPPSPHASDASLPVPETPPGLDSAGDDLSVTMDHIALPDSAHSANRGESNGALKNGDQAHSSGFSASNGEHHGEDTPSVKGSASASASENVVNGRTSNGHQENGDSSKSRKGEKVANGENGESPTIPSKRPTCRYMAATESAKAKFRSNSNPKTRAPDTPESPARTPKRYSIGGSPLTTSKGTDSPKTAFGTRKSQSFQNRGSPSPKAGTPKEKPARAVETGAESPARRNSIGGADGKRWRT